MLSKIKVDDYSPHSNDILLLDTNILITLFYPIMTKSAMSPYQNLYARALKNNVTFILPSIQVSEFINKCIRFSYDLYRGNVSTQEFEFKRDYRNTDDYRESMQTILDIIQNDILPIFSVVDDHFSEVPQDKIYLYGFSYDFNDALLIQIAERQNASIVTHDSDFANYQTKVNLISSNSKLLMFR